MPSVLVHGFSALVELAFRPASRLPVLKRHGFSRTASTVLYQGTTSVVPISFRLLTRRADFSPSVALFGGRHANI